MLRHRGLKALLFGAASLALLFTAGFSAKAAVATRVTNSVRLTDSIVNSSTPYLTARHKSGWGNLYKLTGSYGNVKVKKSGTLQSYKNTKLDFSGRAYLINGTTYIGICKDRTSKVLGYAKSKDVSGQYTKDAWDHVQKYEYKTPINNLAKSRWESMKMLHKHSKTISKTYRGKWYSANGRLLKLNPTTFQYNKSKSNRVQKYGSVDFFTYIYQYPTEKQSFYAMWGNGNPPMSFEIFKVKDKHNKIHTALYVDAVNWKSCKLIFYRSKFKGAKYHVKNPKVLYYSNYHYYSRHNTKVMPLNAAKTCDLIPQNKVVNIKDLK